MDRDVAAIMSATTINSKTLDTRRIDGADTVSGPPPIATKLAAAILRIDRFPCHPGCDRLSTWRLARMTDAKARVHRGARGRGGVSAWSSS